VIGYEQIEYASVTDVGMRRPHNEDSHAVLLATEAEQWQQQGHILLVADGMGGHAVGELASEIAANVIPHTYHKYAAEGPDPALRKAFVEANASIHARGQQNREFHKMGTTSTALLLRPEGAWVAHVGDSRVYRIRDGRIEQLSFDHSLVWEMARRQRVDPESLQGAASNIIVRSLGPDPLVQVDVEGPHPLRVGDTYVVCSDGLSGQLTDPEIGAVASVLPPAEACRFLVNLANLRGGPDNITVLIVHVGGTAAEPEPPPAPAGPVPWYRRIPWPFTALFVGVLLAAEAALLAALDLSTKVYAFTLAAAVLVTGLAGLILYGFQERRHALVGPGGRPLHIYRQASCRIDRPLVERMAQAAATLKRWAQDKNWDADWTASHKHEDQARTFLDQGDLPAAYREYCRALRPFAEAIQRYRFREEDLPPVWEKT
jgi:protein phosphatase